MINYGKDTIKNIYQQINLYNFGKVKYNKTNFYIFSWINKNIVDIN